MKLNNYAVRVCAAVIAALFAIPAAASTSTEDLYQKVTGMRPTAAQVAELESKVKSSAQPVNALIGELFKNPDFVENRLATFISRLSNEDAEPYEEVDDYQAALLLAIDSDIDFRDILAKPFYISTAADPGNAVRPRSDSYVIPRSLESLAKLPAQYRLNFGQPAKPLQVFEGHYAGGLMTTNGFGARFVKGGTNRRPVRAMYDIFLCSKIESWKDASLDHFYIGADIDRVPGDNALEFETRCSSCHAPMDAQRGAMAYYDYEEAMRELRRLNEVAKKMNQNSSIFPTANPTIDDTWENLLVTPEHQKRFGWRGPTRGKGPLSFARMIADSRQFQTCMTQKLTAEFCDMTEEKVSDLLNNPEFIRLADSFRQDGYRIKSLIRNIVKSPLCK